MAIEIFIGNLNYETESERLRDHLGQFGTITRCRVITDKFTFRSKGFATAETTDMAEAEKIISGASGTILDGRPLKVERFRDS
ncbi:MAG: RNA-binding protein [Spirochaetales bacterium]|nr:RNA-binding protein [Spirochaetales bacterium]